MALLKTSLLLILSACCLSAALADTVAAKSLAKGFTVTKAGTSKPVATCRITKVNSVSKSGAASMQCSCTSLDGKKSASVPCPGQLKTSRASGRKLQQTCPVLDLVVGAISLNNLLGLELFTSEITARLNAIAAPGNLLGQLVCLIANLLNGLPTTAGSGLLTGLLSGLLGLGGPLAG